MTELNKIPACSKPLLANRLSFYIRPFYMTEWGSQVYDAKDNFVFEFEDDVPNEQEVIFSLNALDNEPIEGLKLTIEEFDCCQILNDMQPFILIRGWGNLTGGYNFSKEKATKIQDDFRDWIIYKLSTPTT